MSGFIRGLVAGAAGTTALNAATYLDMAARGRAASEVPAETVEELAKAAGLTIAGRGAERAHRVEGLSAVAGIVTGVGIGGVFGWLRRRGLRLGVLGPVVIGGSAMAATDLSIARLGISDPSSWSASDWAADVVPHLAYGCVTHAALVATDRESAAPPRLRTIGRAALAGLATGGRTSSALAALALTHRTPSRKRRRAARTAGIAMAGAELVFDKAPAAPSRLEPPGLVSRGSAATAAATGLARRAGEDPALPVATATIAAGLGALAGLRWRAVSTDRLGLSPVGAALLEDAVVAGLALAATAGT